MNFCRSSVMVFIHPERVLREAHGVHCGEAPPRSGFVQPDGPANGSQPARRVAMRRSPGGWLPSLTLAFDFLTKITRIAIGLRLPLPLRTRLPNPT